MTDIKKKSIAPRENVKALVQGLIGKDIDIEQEMEKVNRHTIEPLKPEDVYLFEIELCDNDVDRVYDKMTDSFLEQIANNIVGVTGLKDHDWSSDNQISRLYDASVVIDSKPNSLGETRKYVLGRAYTLSKYKDYIDKIKSGLLKESSIAFKSVNDTCSICGEPMIKDSGDIGHCKNGHVAGDMIDGKLCYNSINELADVMEWSLVAVPCQHKAGIKNKGLERSSRMKRTELLIKQFMATKAFKEADKESKEALEKAMTEESDKELTDEDIKGLIEENEKLKAKVKELEAKVKEEADGRTRDKIEAIVSKAVDDMNPITPKVKEMFMKEIPWDALELRDGQIPGMADVFNKMKKGYDGLFVEEEDIEKVGGHNEPDGDEAAVVEVEKEEPDGDEGKVMISRKQYNGFSMGTTKKGVTKKDDFGPVGIKW